VYILIRFFFSKCSMFHNSNVFASCISHILYTGCAKIKKNNSRAKRFVMYSKQSLLCTSYLPMLIICSTSSSSLISSPPFSEGHPMLYIYIHTHTHIHGSVHHESNLINCPTRCDLFNLLLFCKQLYMFRVLTPIIRSWYSCNYSFWY